MSFILQTDGTFFTFQFSVIAGQRCLASWSSWQDILLFCQTCPAGLRVMAYTGVVQNKTLHGDILNNNR